MSAPSSASEDSSVLPDSTETHLPVNSTEISQFADSAIDMPKIEDSLSLEIEEPSEPTAPITTLSERLEQLTTAVWEAEQDRRLSPLWTKRLHKDLDGFEAHLDNEVENVDSSQPLVAMPIQQVDLSSRPAQDEELKEVLNHLTGTISSMRLRRQEHQHLHQLSRTKLEAVAQRCVVQEAQLGDMDRGMSDLRRENEVLGTDNDILRDRIEALEADLMRREVAVDAMTSAVAGLEGWIEDTRRGVGVNAVSPVARNGPRRTVIRGRGRFRGKYYVDELEGGGSGYSLDGGSDAKDLHEGVRSWLRGFKDVEEEARSNQSDRVHISKEVAEDNIVTEEDWGEFEVVS